MKKILILLMIPVSVFSQGYTSYFTGNTNNITTITTSGTCLMGGASESDNAMRWMLQRANGGDVVVLRCSGSNGYNNYLYSDLGVTVNSVETLLISSMSGATSPYVLDKVANAEMIWFAGGDQSLYVNYFKNNALEDLLNNHVNIKRAPIGGTSAGMAILGGKYFSASNGTVTSAQALSNPFNNLITIGLNDFIDVPFLNNTITDTHFDNPDRKGRLMTFLARNTIDSNQRNFAIASNEYVAVCIDALGKAIVFGDYPNYQEFAYFLQSNCQTNFIPETCQVNSNLTWNRGGEAVKVYKVPGTINGDNYLELSDWQSGSGGSWENWSVNNGALTTVAGLQSICNLSADDFGNLNFLVSPVPFSNEIKIDNIENAIIKILDFSGKIVFEGFYINQAVIKTNNLLSGIYIVSINQNNSIIYKKIVKNN